MKEFYLATTNTSYVVLAIATIIGLYKWKLLRGYEKCYIIYLLFICCIEIMSNAIIDIFGAENTDLVYSLYIIGSFIIFGCLYTLKLRLPQYVRWAMMGISALYIILHYKFDISLDFIKAYSTLIIICLIGASLLVKIKKNMSGYRFIMVDSFLFLYSLVSVFLFIILNQLQMSTDTFYIIWSINNILSSVLYYSFIKNFLQLKK